MEMRLELIPLPVADVDRARDFYANQVGFHLDYDVPNDIMRVVQLTPPGSACSILIGTGLGEVSQMTPGTVKNLHLVVQDVAAVREMLAGRGVPISPVTEYPNGYKFAYFSDPDGNSWALQQFPPRQ